MVRCLVLLVGGLASLWTFSLQAQEAVLGQLYGSGVHAYFSGDYLQAYEKLTAAIDAGSRDPRVFYFRGLVYLKLGRTPEAQMDFQRGSERETKDVNKFYNVARALERVQGLARLQLEAYRVQARMIALEEAEKLRKARYEAIQREEERVLQRQAEEAAAAPAHASAEVVPVPAGAAAGTESVPQTNVDPFAESKAEKQPAGAEKTPAAKPSEAVEDPFTAKPAEEEKPAAEDPFAAKPSTEEKPAGNKSIISALGKAISKGATGGNGSADKPSAE